MSHFSHSLLLLLIFGFGTAAEAQETIFIGDFEQQQEEFPKLMEAGTLLKVEGRVGLTGPTRVKFRNSELRFAAPKGKKLPELARHGRYLEVHGKLARVDDEITFVIDDVRQLLPDLTRFRQREQAFRGDTTEPLYDLAAWGFKRAKYYEDETLLAEAQELAERAIFRERPRQITGPLSGWRTLAEKVKAFELPADLSQSILHEGYVWYWRTLQEQKQSPTAEVLKQLSEDLPGSLEPLKPPQPNLRMRYTEAPIAVHHFIEPGMRPKLHRVLYSELRLLQLQAEVKDPTSNGYEVAEKIDEELPEFYDIAESYRERELTWRRSMLNTLTQSQVVELSEKYRQRNEPEEARATLEEWVQHQEKSLRAEGLDGLLRAAWLYRSLLEDTASEARLLLEANRLNSELKEVETRLVQLGYRRVNGQWLNEQQRENQSEDPLLDAIREGRVLVGMTPEQVQRSQGKPVSISRMATAGQITEVWTYGERGKLRSVISFRRSARTGDAAVTEVLIRDAPLPGIPRNPE